MSVRDAGDRITAAGLDRDVIQAREGQIMQRRGRQREAAEDDADDARQVRKQPKEERKQKPPRLPEEDDAEDFEDEDQGDDADDGSNREDGDEDDGEDGAEDHEDGDEGEDADDDATSDDDREYTVKIDGKEYSVPVKELIAGYQRGRDYYNKTQALANNGRTLTAGHQKVAETYTRKLQQANGVIGKVRDLLIGDVNSAEMAALRVQDPQKWAVQRQVMADRIAQVDSVLQQIHQEHERHTAEYTATQNAARNATLDQERVLLHQAIPDWDNGGAERLARYIASAGFTAAELEGVTDARMLSIAEKARKWDALQAAKKKPMTKKAKPTPRAPARPGQGQIRKGAAQTTARRREFDSAKSKAKKTGDMRDAGRAISRLL